MSGWDLGEALLSRFRIPPHPIARTGDDTPARTVFHYVWRMSGTHQVWVSLLAVVIASLSFIPLELQRRIINDAVGGSDVGLLVLLAGIYVGVAIIDGALKFMLHVYQGWLSESAIRYNREHLAELQVANSRTSDGDGREGRAVTIIGSEIDKLGGFVGEGISVPVTNIGMLVAIIGYMLVVQPLVALVALVLLAPQAAIVPWLQGLINRLTERRLGLLRDLSDNIVMRSESEPSQRDQQALLRDLDSIYGNHVQIFVIKFLMKASTNLMSAMAPLTVLAVGGYFVMTEQTTIGVVVAFISGFQRLAEPLSELLTYYRTAAQASVQHRMIADWMTGGGRRTTSTAAVSSS
jgi:ABC-type multidrug transport system fused ATPase/permease subunit